MVKVLFVCMGNICRSPTAHGVFQEFVQREGLTGVIAVDSAGTHAYHIGEQPDRRAQATALRRGVDLGSQKARRVAANDFVEFDYILAMDRDNYTQLAAQCPSEHRQKVQLFMEYAPELGYEEVPDPYYGGPQGFEQVFDMVEAAALGLMGTIKLTHLNLK